MTLYREWDKLRSEHLLVSAVKSHKGKPNISWKNVHSFLLFPFLFLEFCDRIIL